MDAYVNYAFNKSVEGMFQEFKRGFFLVCDQQLVKLFRPEELQGVLVGGDVYDWVKLKQVHSSKWFTFSTALFFVFAAVKLTTLSYSTQNTQYEWVSDKHPTIQMFWVVFDELTEEQKKDFICK